MSEMSIRVGDGEYVLSRDGGNFRVGRRVGNDVTWLDEVDPGLLPEQARSALDRGDTEDPALQTALRGVVQAEVERGG